MRPITSATFIACALVAPTLVGSAAHRSQYSWHLVTAAAEFPGSYNFPVFVVRGEKWAMHPEGAWRSADGKRWHKTALPASGLNGAYQKYVQLDDAVYALGTMTGSYLDLHLTSRIMRTTDLEALGCAGGPIEPPGTGVLCGRRIPGDDLAARGI